MKNHYVYLLLPLMLIACSDNGGGNEASDAFVAETKKIVNTTADDTEPVDVSKVTVTLPETQEPVDI